MARAQLPEGAGERVDHLEVAETLCYSGAPNIAGEDPEDAALKNSSPTCDALAVEKKLAGSARTRFMRNCIAQRSGGPPG